MNGWILTWACISKTATEVELRALTGNMTAGLHLWKNRSAVKLMETKAGCTDAVHDVMQRLFFPAWPNGGLTEEMSGVHLASISSIMSPSGLELTGLSTEPRLQGDSERKTAALPVESEVSCKCLCSHSQLSVLRHRVKPRDLFKLTEAAISWCFLSVRSCWSHTGEKLALSGFLWKLSHLDKTINDSKLEAVKNCFHT